MNHENQQIQFDERVDHYLRGKMNEEEEVAFEIEYLENPDLLAQVEMVDQLIKGLKQHQSTISLAAANTENITGQVKESTTQYNTGSEPTVISKIKQWLADWATPQAAWGAVAATVFLVPLMSILNNQTGPSLSSPQVQGTYVHLLGQKVRSTTNETATIYIEPGQSNVVVGFATEPTFGVPEPLSVTVYNANEQVVWQQQGLQPDYRWTVYLSINSASIESGEYRYELTNGDSIVNSGNFAMDFSG